MRRTFILKYNNIVLTLYYFLVFFYVDYTQNTYTNYFKLWYNKTREVYYKTGIANPGSRALTGEKSQANDSSRKVMIPSPDVHHRKSHNVGQQLYYYVTEAAVSKTNTGKANHTYK